MENVEYRGYFFVNALYMKEIQWGLQTAHCVASMFGAFLDEHGKGMHFQIPELKVLAKWANYDKTIIILNGGNHDELNAVHDEIKGLARQLKLPCQLFNEDGQSLNFATTCVGIIVPDSVYALPLEPMYATTDIYGPVPAYPFMDETPERQLKRILSKYSLAR